MNTLSTLSTQPHNYRAAVGYFNSIHKLSVHEEWNGSMYPIDRLNALNLQIDQAKLLGLHDVVAELVAFKHKRYYNLVHHIGEFRLQP